MQTFNYRAPEVELGSGFWHPVDMWSVGCILVEMFIGKQFIQGDYDRDCLFTSLYDSLG